MSAIADPAYAEFLKQLESMRQVIAELKLGQRSSDRPKPSGTASNDDDLIGGSGSDDIWDISSEEEDEDELDEDDSDDGLDYLNSEGTPPEPHINGSSYDRDWLRRKSTACAHKSSGLDATELEEQILATLALNSQSRFGP